MENIYKTHGYKNRKHYLKSLAEKYGKVVFALADILGPSEDFDGLVFEVKYLSYRQN